MARVIAYDLARLFLAPLFLAPRGIDKVDLAMARHVFADEDSPHLGILPTFWGVRAYRAAQVRRMLDHVHAVWAEREHGDRASVQDLRFAQVVAQIRSAGTEHRRPIPPPRQLTLGDKVVRMVHELVATGMPPGRPVRGFVPKGAIYLNIGQLGLAVPLFFNWLEQRPDVTCAIMLHDVIPLDFPHLVRPGSAEHHGRMVRTAARHADCMIYTTAYARDTVNASLAQNGRPHLPSLVRPLPLSAAFTEVAGSLPDLAGTRYCLVVSTIEPRKNHDLLFRVWRRLIARLGKDAPHLVIVGSRGFDADRILAPIARSAVLRAHVHEVSGLSSHALAQLMLGATGLLSPTYVEGFGLPVLEANVLGVPTVASNIAAHREIARENTTLLACDDDEAWERAILALPPTATRERPPISHDMTEAAYCGDLLAYLGSVLEGRQGIAARVTA
jgi:glycosyltransferase involved in cell wall biosynthesis